MRSGNSIHIITLILLTVIFAPKLFSQTTFEYSELKKYRKWGIVAGPILYNRAELEPQYGDYTLENKPMLGFNAGFEYDFYPDRKWSVITGFVVALEPIYKVSVDLKKEDVYSHFEEDVLTLDDKSYSMTSFSVPILLRLNLPISKRVFVNFRTGLKAMYFPEGSAYLNWTFHNEDDTEAKEVFGLKVESPENSFQGSFIIGAGSSYALNRVLLKANIVYVMTFQNSMEGEYLFDNMFVSERSRGYYTLSGNYLGLLFSASLAKKKNKK